MVELLELAEVDRDGRLVLTMLFDPDDVRAAQREMWTRWAAIDPAVAPGMTALGEAVDVWDSKDPERLRAVLAEDLVVEDHRRTGTGRLEGREAYVQSVVALWKLAPDSRFEAGRFWLAIAPHGGVYAARRIGTVPDGGEFQSDFVIVSLLEGGRTARLELFEIDAVDAALARFEELRPGSAS